MTSRILFASILALALTPGCSGDDGGAGSTGTGGALAAGGAGGAGGVGGAGGGDPSEACADLELQGEGVNIRAEATEAPTPVGGTVEDGTYYLTEALAYTGPGGTEGVSDQQMRGVIRIAGDRMETVFELGDEPAQSYVSTFTTSGTELTTKDSCPEPDETTVGYSVEGLSITLFAPISQGTSALTFVRPE